MVADHEATCEASVRARASVMVKVRRLDKIAR
jgi:hypothetical protein